MFNIYVGGVGSGKTTAAVRDAILHPGNNVYVHASMGITKVPAKIEGQWKNVIQWETLDDLSDARCGVILIDEADMFFNSRDYAKLNDVIRRKMKEHRKDHVYIIATTQHISFVDKVMRIFVDEVRLIERHGFPFIGWFWRDSARPPIICRSCRMMRPDGIGDRVGWRKWFGMGTFYSWKGYPASILGEDESAKAVDIKKREENATDDKPPLHVSQGRFFFSSLVASVYDTSAKVSDHFNHGGNAGTAHA